MLRFYATVLFIFYHFLWVCLWPLHSKNSKLTSLYFIVYVCTDYRVYICVWGSYTTTYERYVLCEAERLLRVKPFN